MLTCSCSYSDFKNIQFPGNNIIILTCCYCEKIITIDLKCISNEDLHKDAEFKYISMF